MKKTRFRNSRQLKSQNISFSFSSSLFAYDFSIFFNVVFGSRPTSASMTRLFRNLGFGRWLHHLFGDNCAVRGRHHLPSIGWGSQQGPPEFKCDGDDKAAADGQSSTLKSRSSRRHYYFSPSCSSRGDKCKLSSMFRVGKSIYVLPSSLLLRIKN